MATYKKLSYEDIPEFVRQRVISWSDTQVIFDDTGLTPQQQAIFDQFMLQLGYKKVT